MAYHACLLAICVTFCISVTSAITRPSATTLENNEYKHILAAISPDAPDNFALIAKIKDAFTKGSAYMYTATNERAVFKDVTILVPSSWHHDASYGAATTQVFNDADIIFAAPMAPAPPPAPDESVHVVSRSVASTRAYAGCGQPGVRVIMQTDLFTDNRLRGTVGAPERVLMQEWARFRWGVFDEYGLEGEPQFYFSPTTGQVEGVRCTEQVAGIIAYSDASGRPVYCRDLDPVTGLYPDNCSFKPYPGGPTQANSQASVMDHAYVTPLTKFCDDNQGNNATFHNFNAPSRHNRLCSHRSTWAVISESGDFANGANPPRHGADTVPVFTVVQAPSTRRMVLALDTSASMAEGQKLLRTRQAVRTFIQEGVTSTTQVGLTTFNDAVEVRRAPMSLNTSGDRDTFLDDLPDSEGGATDIATVLLSTVQLLNITDTVPTLTAPSTTPKTVTTSTAGGHVLVITDGEETSGPDLTTISPTLQKSGVVFSFIVLGGPPPASLVHLAQSTGGRIYCDNNRYDSTATVDAMFDVLTNYDERLPSSPLQILSRAWSVIEGQSVGGVVSVDEEVGAETSFLISFSDTLPEIRIESPSGRVYSHLYPEYNLDQRLQTAKILIPSKAETGIWRYTLTNTHGYQRLSLLVLSSPNNSSSKPVQLSGALVMKRNSQPANLHIFADILRSGVPVTELRVTASVDRPGGDSISLDLLDNGAGADIVQGDGIYSRCFTQLTEPGLYTVRITSAGYWTDDNDEIHFTGGKDRYVQRTVSAGHVVISSVDRVPRAAVDNINNDVEPPVRISDLRVVKTSNRNRSVVLSWTASGDDTDHGSASVYDVLVAPQVKDLLTKSLLVQHITQDDVIFGNLRSPKVFGTREYYEVRIPLSFGTRVSCVFAVVAVDDVGNKGEHSNYVTVGLGNVPDMTDEKFWHEGQLQLALASEDDDRQHHKVVIAGVLGTMSALLVIVLLVSIIVTCFTRRDPSDKIQVKFKQNKIARKKIETISLKLMP